ncbi:MAG: MBL fold metallo-hydrolase [Caulobacteraceae bacterium]
MRKLIGGTIAAALLSSSALAAEPACRTLTPALIGGPVPAASSDTAVIRWLGTANYEVAYKGKVYLFDAFYDRNGRTRSIGFKVDQVRRADVIFIGHAHYDHISDIAAVARQTRGPWWSGPGSASIPPSSSACPSARPGWWRTGIP